jgi:hypothetical protein
MDSFFGVPAHPLLVHIPVVLIPLAAVGVVVMAIRPAWHQRYRWAVLAIAVVGMVGAILATEAGESLADQIVAKKGVGAEVRWEDHAELGETARLAAFIFVVVLVVYVIVPWYVDRRATTSSPLVLPRWVLPLLAAGTLVAAAGAVYTVFDAGHSGADAVWCDTNTPPTCETGG